MLTSDSLAFSAHVHVALLIRLIFGNSILSHDTARLARTCEKGRGTVGILMRVENRLPAMPKIYASRLVAALKPSM